MAQSTASNGDKQVVKLADVDESESQLQQYLQQFNSGAGNHQIRTRDPQESYTMFKTKMAARPTVEQAGTMSPLAMDYKSEASGRDRESSFYAVKALQMRPIKPSETPSQKHQDLANYLNWVPTKEKLTLAALQSKGSKANKLSPLRAGPQSLKNDDDARSTLSKTVLKGREKQSNSQMGRYEKDMSIDGISLSGQQQKPRAFSNLRTINGYGPANHLDVSSVYIKKNATPSMMSPAPKRRILDELSWEDRQKVLGFSMAKINSLKRDDLLRAITLPHTSPMHAKLNQIRKLQTDADTTQNSIDEALKKLARQGDEYTSMKDFSKAVIKRFDTDLDGIISFHELCEGLKLYDIHLPLKDRVALMKRLDMNSDGAISDIELYRALSTIEPQLTKETVTKALKKIVKGGDDYASMKEYSKALIRRFDGNNDGLISFAELDEGLRKMKIVLNKRELNALMNKIDLNQDGEITQDELYKVLSSVERTVFPKNIVQLSIEQAIHKLVSAGDSFSSLKEYARHLIKKFDENQDGIISFQELVDGLLTMGINMNLKEMQALMRRLDINKDGNITEDELCKVLQQANDTIPPALLPQIIDQTLKKIATGADDFSNMKEYARSLIKRFDRNNDGIISFKELCDGLKTINIYLTQREKEGLMKKLDTNQDGNISEHELFKAFSTIDVDHLKQMVKDQADIALKKLAGGAEECGGNMREYVKTLIRKFDGNSDGIISFDELVSGVKQMHIFLTLKEKIALMKRLDLNRDGEITADELYKVLSKVDIKFNQAQLQESVDQVLRKIAAGAEDFSSMKQYVRAIVSRFDFNHDGLISFDELVESLQHFKINLTNQEKQALMKRLDHNRDGDITEDEILRALTSFELAPQQQLTSFQHSRTPASEMVLKARKDRERVSVDEIIVKLKKAASKYESIKHYVANIMRRYDQDGDGFLNFQELSDGLSHDHIKLTREEKLALMKHLDTDCDGVISKDEIFEALLIDARHRRNHHHPGVNVDHLLKRIRQGAEKFKTLDLFVKSLFEKFDTDATGSLSFKKLSIGLSNMGIEITEKEKHALMKRLDHNADGVISYEELYQGLSEVSMFKQSHDLNPSQAINIDHALQRIARGAEQYKCLEDYIILLFRKFDVNKDGAISFREMREGLNSLNVHLSDNEIHSLFHFLDSDRDGEITQEELYNALLTKEKYFKSPKIHQQLINVDQVLNLIKKGVEKYSSLEEYVNALMARFDVNGDGLISIEELGEGLKSINVKISEKEKLALMKELDKDRDGGISRQELSNALSTPVAFSKPKELDARSKSPLPGFNNQALSAVDHILLKIRRAVSHYKSQQEQIIGLLRIFDLDNDGLISFLELVDGVKSIGINCKKSVLIDLMNKIDTDKDGFITQIELYRALDLKPEHEGYQGTSVTIDQVLSKLRRGAEKYHSVQEYVSVLFQMFAKAGSSFMTFQELMNCLKTFNFNLQQVEKIQLMKKMDENGDNQISKEEFYNALIQTEGGVPTNSGGSYTVKQSPARVPAGQGAGGEGDDARVDQALIKIKSGAAKFKNLAEYCAAMMKKFDTNKDGYISSIELVDGLREMGIKIFKGEQVAIMRRLDEDRDGLISYEELFKGLSRVAG